MQRRILMGAFCAIALAAPVLAGDWPVGTVALSAAQIDRLLSGNTAVGAWSGTAYRQYFDASGATLYVAKGSAPDTGKWRINTETDEYESWWESADWAGYTIVMTNDGYAWVSGGDLQRFRMVSGDQTGD